MESRTLVPVGSGQLDVLVGGRESDTTVLTMHPYEQMDRALPVLAEITEARVACVNPRGVGRSSPPRAPRDSTLEGMATDLDLVRRALGVSRCVFWGMSGGSMIAQVLVHLHPGSVDALILDSAGPCFALTLADPACLMNPAHPRWREERPAWVVRDASGEPLLMAPNEPSDQLRRVVPSLMAFDARSWLGEVRVPTLVVAGAEDEVAPLAQVRALHEALPGSRLAVIEGAGHVPVVQEPDRVGAAVRTFLAEHALR